MIFNETKYTKWYFQIIESAKYRPSNDYREKHHIIPKSLGGDNSADNLVALSARQHFICHRLLVKMTTGKNQRKMTYAFWFMSNRSKITGTKVSRSYEWARKAIAEQMSQRTITDEFRNKCRQRQLGKPMLESTRKALQDANIGRAKTNEEIEKIRSSVNDYYSKTTNPRIGQKRSDEQKRRISEARKASWAKNPNQGTSGKNFKKQK